MIIEQWKDVPNWEEIYQVSNFARVKNLKTGRYLKGYKRKNGYIQLTLKDGDKKEDWLLHRLVCTVWKRPMLTTEDAHHKIKQLKCCNCIYNLEIKDERIHASEHTKGKTAWNKGIPMSEQQKRHLSEINKGKVISQQQKKAMSEGMKRAWAKKKCETSETI